MFFLSLIHDSVHIAPHLFRKAYKKAIIDELNAKYANKVIHHVGLGIGVHSIQRAEEPFVFPGDGGIQVKVTIQLIVFRPFRGEILRGKIMSCTPDGIRLSVGFFNDIFVPRGMLPMPCEFDENEQLWVWKYDDETRLYMDLDEIVHFRCEQEVFTQVNPNKVNEKKSATAASSSKSFDVAAILGSSDAKVPFALVASMSDAGLGCLSWWASSE
jgi:DNA-directed RNA polymerase III subunit RPC8